MKPKVSPRISIPAKKSVNITGRCKLQQRKLVILAPEEEQNCGAFKLKTPWLLTEIRLADRRLIDYNIEIDLYTSRPNDMVH